MDFKNTDYIDASELIDIKTEGGDISRNFHQPVAAEEFKNLDDIERFEIKRLEDFIHLQDKLSSLTLRGYYCYFRGHACKEFKLIPSLARIQNPCEEDEANLLERIKNGDALSNYRSYKLPQFDDSLFYLSIARHLGEKCRLLDWTTGFWQALAFLTEERFIDLEGDLWMMLVDCASVQIENSNPLMISDNCVHVFKEGFFIPEGKSLNDMPLGQKRRFDQCGIFTATAFDKIKMPLNEHNWDNIDSICFRRVSVSSEAKNELRKNSIFQP